MVVMLPVATIAGKQVWTTALGVFLLAAVAVWLFSRRRKLRTAFLLPLVYMPCLAAIYYREHQGVDSASFSLSAGAFVVLSFSAIIIDAFWTPYRDDLAEQQYISKFRE